MIFDLYKKHGNKWVEIAKQIPGRTENWVKNLYYATLRRYVRNINKFKGVQVDIDCLEDKEITEKMLAELFLVDDINFKEFQCIDSDEFKLLSKKVGKSRRRKDIHFSQYILGRYNKGPNKGKLEPLTDENIKTLDSIKRVLLLLRRSNQIKLAPVRILKEEGKDGSSYTCKSRPRRRSTMKKKEKTQAIMHEIRRSKRLSQLGLKRNSDEMKKSAFVQIINSKKQKTTEEHSLSPSPVKHNPLEERKEEIIHDDDANSLKIPSLKDFNVSNNSIQDISKHIYEEKMSDSSLSKRRAYDNISLNLMEKLSDGINGEEKQIRGHGMYRRSSRKNQDYFRRAL